MSATIEKKFNLFLTSYNPSYMINPVIQTKVIYEQSN
nr:MAG TPA: hypothetical protein [Bacteriophage sp.]